MSDEQQPQVTQDPSMLQKAEDVAKSEYKKIEQKLENLAASAAPALNADQKALVDAGYAVLDKATGMLNINITMILADLHRARVAAEDDVKFLIKKVSSLL